MIILEKNRELNSAKKSISATVIYIDRNWRNCTFAEGVVTFKCENLINAHAMRNEN